MGYRALYRVWRPQRFDEIVGQPVIVQTLKNAIKAHQVSHAYLFAGPRGTGKTSAAKIFAKAVNCPHQTHGEPCNHCSICRAITKGQLDDVIEIDAASNNGVDEIREVRNKANYAPTRAKYKIYIIDEVHMLSTGAFNALLKTLEEPPANVIFIMATTEPQKIPATIISRTQRFNFRRIRPQDILRRMEYILKQDRVKFDVKALKVIARAAEGGMRDALSILDEAISYGVDQVTYQNALQVTGSVTQQLLNRYLNDVIHHQTQNALIEVHKILVAGKDANQFVESLIDYCQKVLLYQQDPKMVLRAELGIVDNHFKKLAQDISADLLYLIIERLNKIEEQMRFTLHPDVYLEVLTVQISMIKKQISPAKKVNQLILQLHRLSKEVQSLKQNQSSPVSVAHHSSQRPKGIQNHSIMKKSPAADSVDQTRIDSVLNHATHQSLSRIDAAWSEVIRSLPVTERALMNVSKPVAASTKGIVVAFAYDFLCQRASHDQELVKTLKIKLDQILGNLPTIVFIPNSQWPRIRNRYLGAHRSFSHISGGRSKANQSMVNQLVRIFGKDINQVIKVKND